MHRSLGTTRFGFHLLALAVVLLGTRTCVLAADEIDEVLSSSGKIWYDKYCTPCHGAGGAPGTAVYRANKQPVDLREYVKAHGGQFPAHDWLAIIADTRPSSVHAAVWEKIKRNQSN